MSMNWLEFAQRLAQGARAKLIEDRQRLEKIEAQPASGQRQAEVPASGR